MMHVLDLDTRGSQAGPWLLVDGAVVGVRREAVAEMAENFEAIDMNMISAF